jgi:kinesin family protein 22
MQGTSAEPGIIPRSVDTVLKMIKSIEEKDKKAKSQALPYSVSVSYYEIYNEKLYDLLEAKETDLPIREDMSKNIVIPGLADVCTSHIICTTTITDTSQVSINDFKHFETLYEQGCRNRSTGPTKLNNQSSRSHAILTIKVQRVDGNKKIAGKLHLIDLAGSEDNRRTDNTGVRYESFSYCSRTIN